MEKNISFSYYIYFSKYHAKHSKYIKITENNVSLNELTFRTCIVVIVIGRRF